MGLSAKFRARSSTCRVLLALQRGCLSQMILRGFTCKRASATSIPQALAASLYLLLVTRRLWQIHTSYCAKKQVIYEDSFRLCLGNSRLFFSTALPRKRRATVATSTRVRYGHQINKKTLTSLYTHVHIGNGYVYGVFWWQYNRTCSTRVLEQLFAGRTHNKHQIPCRQRTHKKKTGPKARCLIFITV